MIGVGSRCNRGPLVLPQLVPYAHPARHHSSLRRCAKGREGRELTHWTRDSAGHTPNLTCAVNELHASVHFEAIPNLTQATPPNPVALRFDTVDEALEFCEEAILVTSSATVFSAPATDMRASYAMPPAQLGAQLGGFGDKRASLAEVAVDSLCSDTHPHVRPHGPSRPRSHTRSFAQACAHPLEAF